MSLNVVHSFSTLHNTSKQPLYPISKEANHRQKYQGKFRGFSSSKLWGSTSSWRAETRVTMTNYCASRADFSVGYPWDNSTTDTPKKPWLATRIVHQSSLITIETAFLVANTYCHSQPDIDVFLLFLDKKRYFLFIGDVWLVVYTCFLKKAIMSIVIILIAKLPRKLTETAS